MINLYLIDYFDRKNSGLATYVNQLSGHLAKDNRIALHFIFVKAVDHPLFQKEKLGDVIFYYIPHDIALRNNLENDIRLVNYLKQETKNKQRVIFHFNWVNHAPFAQLLKKKINCKTLLTKHCIPWRDLITDNYPMFQNINQQFLSKENITHLDSPLVWEHVAYHSVDHIICVTRFAQQALLRMLGFPEEKTTVIYNGLNFQKPKKQLKEKLKAKYGFHPHEQLILFAGHIHQRKGTHDLISSFDSVLRKNKHARLVIAGEGDYSGILKNAQKNWSKITLTGNLDKKTLYNFYQMADVGVLPSYIEQCSYTAIEMMYHGLPIVVSDVDGLTEIVPNNCGLKTPIVLGKNKANIEKICLAKNILCFLESRNTSNRYALNASKHVSQNFDAERMAAKTIRVYEKIVGEVSPRKSAVKSLPNNPLVSVLLPCHNGQNYLNACMESVLRQTYPTFEFIIINDASTDGTAKLLKRYQDKRINILHNEKNSGIVASLNRGIQLAKGKYIARIDADDMMHEDRLYKQVRHLEEGEKAGIVLVGSHHHIIDQTGRIVGLKQYPISNDEITNVLLFQNPFSHPSVMVRSDILKRMKYDSKFPYAEDYHLWFKILKKYKASNIPEYLTYYRIHDNNVSKQKSIDQRESVADLLSTELYNLGIEHTASELALHMAICLGYRARYFNTPERINALEKWISKVLQYQQKTYKYPNKFLEKMKQYIRLALCSAYTPVNLLIVALIYQLVSRTSLFLALPTISNCTHLLHDVNI